MKEVAAHLRLPELQAVEVQQQMVDVVWALVAVAAMVGMKAVGVVSALVEVVGPLRLRILPSRDRHQLLARLRLRDVGACQRGIEALELSRRALDRLAVMVEPVPVAMPLPILQSEHHRRGFCGEDLAAPLCALVKPERRRPVCRASQGCWRSRR